ncbi:MAG: hypothetical protein ABIW33_07885 [Sphingomicrobium sp.]
MKPAFLLLVTATAALAGCGRVTDLQPAPGQSLPVKPLMARSTPTPADLLTPPAYARPERVDDLAKRSQPRAVDPFDLPPPTGGAAPAEPAGSESQPATDPTGVTPGE